MKNYSNHPIINIYLNYANDFLSLGSFADWLEVSEDLASQLINEGRELYNLTK